MKITLHCYIINYYLTQWTDNRMPDKRGTDNRGSTVLGTRGGLFMEGLVVAEKPMSAKLIMRV